jgi:hypothetical protein
MPHVSDVPPTSHDRHDTMLVAALAAGDLAATDRDEAIALTASCVDCASLHDDLVAIARATATVPPPIAAPTRDFRLTPADVARLRPGGWRRLVAAFSAPRLAVARPLGVGLTTLGLVGLLIGNVSLNVGGSPSTPEAATISAGGDNELRAAASAPAGGPAAAPAVPAASTAALGPVAAFDPSASNGPAASTVPDQSVTSSGDVAGSHVPDIAAEGFGPAASGGTKAAPTDNSHLFASGEPSRDAAQIDPIQTRNLLFVAAVVVGLGLLIASRFRSRPKA